MTLPPDLREKCESLIAEMPTTDTSKGYTRDELERMFTAAYELMSDREIVGAGKFLTQACTIGNLEDEIKKLKKTLDFEILLSHHRMRVSSVYELACRSYLKKEVIDILEEEIAKVVDEFRVEKDALIGGAE